MGEREKKKPERTYIKYEMRIIAAAEFLQNFIGAKNMQSPMEDGKNELWVCNFLDLEIRYGLKIGGLQVSTFLSASFLLGTKNLRNHNCFLPVFIFAF